MQLFRIVQILPIGGVPLGRVCPASFMKHYPVEEVYLKILIDQVSQKKSIIYQYIGSGIDIRKYHYKSCQWKSIVSNTLFIFCGIIFSVTLGLFISFKTLLLLSCLTHFCCCCNTGFYLVMSSISRNISSIQCYPVVSSVIQNSPVYPVIYCDNKYFQWYPVVSSII